ncbi:MAG: glycosyltransferase [Candidatus Omnitrophica bacterium]|nr:glycosyltransferase [Candidatus Omnitrophota bacterium]
MNHELRTPKPESRTTAEDCCRICCHQRIIPDVLTWENHVFSRCLACGFIFQTSGVSFQASRQFYEGSYDEGTDELLVGIRKARDAIYEDVLNRVKFCRQNGRLLDVGAGHGEFLIPARDAGWEVFAIEPSKKASEAAGRIEGVQVLNGTVAEVEFAENYFDVITLWNVIDCLPDPAASLRKIKKWLAPGGQLVIRTPNASFYYPLYRSSLFLKRLDRSKDTCVFHRHNFSRKAIWTLLRNLGFDSIEIKNGRPTQGDPHQIFSGFNFIRFVRLISGGRLLIGSDMVIFASKESAAIYPARRKLQKRIAAKRMALRFLAVLGYVLGLPLWQKLTGRDRHTAILLYHSIDETKASDMSVTPSSFEEQITFLNAHYPIVNLSKAVEMIQTGERSDKRHVSITFDDGYEDNFLYAFPVLKKMNLPAAIFLLSRHEGGEYRTPHLEDSVNHPSRLLNWDQVREMAAGGIEFGSHGERHLRLKDLALAGLENEIIRSKETIENLLAHSVDFFSYPYGTFRDFDARAVDMTAKCGYKAALTAVYGANPPGTDLFQLRRINVDASDTLFTLKAKLNGALNLMALFNLPWMRSAVRLVNRLLLSSGLKRNHIYSDLLLVSVDFPPHTDGVSTIARQLAERISKRWNGLFIMGPQDQGAADYDRCFHYRAFRTPGYDWGYLRILPMLIQMPYVVFRFRLRKILALNIGYGGIIAWVLSYFKKMEYVLFAYGYEFEKVRQNRFLYALYRKIYARSKKIICCSENVRQRLIAFGVEASKTVTLYPAVDLQRFKPVKPEIDIVTQYGLLNKKVLLTVGRLIERKGHDRVIEAMARLKDKHPDLVYAIVGKGPHEQALRVKAEALGISDRVKFLGRLSDPEMIAIYNDCKVFIMASREIENEGHVEGFGIVYLEASSLGKPVIGGTSGGMAEAIQDGKTGFLVDTQDIAAISERIDYLFSNPEEAEKMGAAGMEWAHNHFNWDDYVQKTFSYLMDQDLP